MQHFVEKNTICSYIQHKKGKSGGVMLKGIREEKGLSQQEVADKLGINRTSLSKIENGKQVLSSIQLFQLSRLYEVDPYKLLGKEESETIKFAFRGRDKFNSETEQKFEQIEEYINTILELESIENE